MITLRPAALTDHYAIANLHAHNWRLNYRGVLSDRYLDYEVENERLENWHKRLKNTTPGELVTVAEYENELVGFCSLIINEDPVFGSYIDNLHVSSTQQKLGVGKMMMRHAATTVAERADTHKMYLWVYEANANARSAYEKVGVTNFETLDLANVDGTRSPTCRYTWDDISTLLCQPRHPNTRELRVSPKGCGES